MKRIFSLAVALLCACGALACLWDQDTLADEAAGKIDFVRIITGRFERNPPLYYQMRLERVSKALQQDPSKLDEYDNAAVACDRLGNDEEAIRWIDKKRAYMIAHNLTPKTNPDDWYRYYANAGTFHAHLWFKQGAKKDQLKEIKTGRDLIAKALEINPESHFGRERIQLMVLDWVVNGSAASLAKFFELKSEFDHEKAASEAKGLAGLVLLGNAWESIDVFVALENRLSVARDGSLSQLAQLRGRELLAKGAKSLSGEPTPEMWDYPYYKPEESIEQFNEKEYKRLREEADAWHANRTKFMLVRLEAGRHPDTDADFWAGYTELPAPEINSPPFYKTMRGSITMFAIVAGAILLAIIGLPTFFLVRRARRRRRALAT